MKFFVQYQFSPTLVDIGEVPRCIVGEERIISDTHGPLTPENVYGHLSLRDMQMADYVSVNLPDGTSWCLKSRWSTKETPYLLP